MKKRQILWAIVFGSMLAITGCGDDASSNGGSAGSGGSGGTGGTGGTGGSGGDMATGSCQVICDSPCQLFNGVDPDTPTCLADCMAEDWDGCVPETTALVECAEAAQGGNCDINPEPSCGAELDAWQACE